MNYKFDDRYLVKSLIDLIQVEGNRIVSSGLATKDNHIKLLECALKDSQDVSVLASLHNSLSSIKLPGDFEKLAKALDDEFYVVEIICEPEEESKEEESSKKDKDEKKKKAVYDCIIGGLNKLSYKLGCDGNHHEAYAIDRVLRKFEQKIN